MECAYVINHHLLTVSYETNLVVQTQGDSVAHLIYELLNAVKLIIPGSIPGATHQFLYDTIYCSHLNQDLSWILDL